MLKTAAAALAAVFAVNALAPVVLAATKPQKPIEMPPIVVKGERPKK